MTTTKRYSPEVRERSVNLVLKTQQKQGSQWASIRSIAPKIGCIPETLRLCVRQNEQSQALEE